MRLRSLLIAAATFATTLVLAAPAMASGGAGEGWIGETNDKIVTFFCLGMLLFFVFVVVVGSAIQARGERRKDEKKAAQKLARTGW